MRRCQRCRRIIGNSTSFAEAIAGNGYRYFFVDAEDYGTHRAYNGPHKEEYWGLGSQYWARNPHVQGYNARFGILLDMVGGQECRIPL